MTDNPRSRIAEVLYRLYGQCLGYYDLPWERVDQRHFLADADTVIRELGLREEWGALDDDDGGFLADTREELRPGKGETIKRRYITSWEPADG